MISTVSDRGQLVIPRLLREKYEIGKKTRIEWIDTGRGIVLIPLHGDTVKKSRGILQGKKNYLDIYLKAKKQEKTQKQDFYKKGKKDAKER